MMSLFRQARPFRDKLAVTFGGRATISYHTKSDKQPTQNPTVSQQFLPKTPKIWTQDLWHCFPRRGRSNPWGVGTPLPTPWSQHQPLAMHVPSSPSPRHHPTDTGAMPWQVGSTGRIFHGDRFLPLRIGLWEALPNGIFMTYKWWILTTGMILQEEPQQYTSYSWLKPARNRSNMFARSLSVHCSLPLPPAS